MTTAETARALGVSERTIYRAIKKTGMRWYLQRQHRGGSYVFTPEQVVALAEHLKTRNRGYLRATLTPATRADNE
ncbi:helix-turn-helix domain-containing protein [Mycobacterium intracellulare]|uniref:helix-turn-helix domain-containing protein n=1 Tax=Mycobacterium intracellulare TaxID=1767 RepID=UPI0013DFD929|nr:helix-turn-helix domain-containing protein [Mycobacterium intracellulare]